MILTTDQRTVLVHFNAEGELSRRGNAGGAVIVSPGTLARIRWYLEWTGEAVRDVHVLVPDALRSADQELLGRTAHTSKVIRYRDEGDLSLPAAVRKRGFAFIINGNQFPIVHWRRAVTSAQRQNTDVVVFGPSGALSGGDYPESVLVDDDGQVIKFKRHYEDSPGFADRWSGDAAFLVVRSEHAQAVAAHIVVRGWGLDSIGALVRRFGVRWLNDQRVLSDDRLAAQDLMDLSRDRRRSSRIPIADPDNHGIPLQLQSGGMQIYPFEQARDRAQTSSLVASGVQAQPAAQPASVEYTFATDDLPDVYESKAYLFAKRLLDIGVSAAGLIVLLPLFILVSIAIKLTSRGPIFYAHTRQGLAGREFPCLKFRSMRTGADAVQAQLRALNEVDGPQFKMRRDPRVTALGHWLRKTNIDELPQLINVLLGQMSLVGPRPSPDQENQYCPAWRRARLSTKPGITGLWQVLRNRQECASDFQEWIYYDVEYARHRCFWLDLQILFYTPIAMWIPRRVAPFAARLERAEICAHSSKMIYRSVEVRPAES